MSDVRIGKGQEKPMSKGDSEAQVITIIFELLEFLLLFFVMYDKYKAVAIQRGPLSSKTETEGCA